MLLIIFFMLLIIFTTIDIVFRAMGFGVFWGGLRRQIIKKTVEATPILGLPPLLCVTTVLLLAPQVDDYGIVVGTVGAIKYVRRMRFPIISAVKDVVDAHHHGVAVKGAAKAVARLYEGVVKVSR